MNKDLTFKKSSRYLGKNNKKVFISEGNFEWNKAGTVILMKQLKEEPNQYFVGENKLIQLDMEGNKITGILADKYELIKIK